MSREKIISVLLVVFVYIVATGASYMLFSQKGFTQGMEDPQTQNGDEDALAFDDNLPKTEPCPLNGEKYSKKQREWWGHCVSWEPPRPLNPR